MAKRSRYSPEVRERADTSEHERGDFFLHLAPYGHFSAGNPCVGNLAPWARSLSSRYAGPGRYRPGGGEPTRCDRPQAPPGPGETRRSGGPTPASGRTSTVRHHELGHGFQAWSGSPDSYSTCHMAGAEPAAHPVTRSLPTVKPVRVRQ